ncbi:MAG: SRPBCC family protein [Pirellulales bacterium]|nr:SRPBCC family protein [Pirellulales bacterium]
MKVYTLKQIQRLPIDLDQAWEFFSNPRNLSKITPPALEFECLDEFDEMRPGMMLMYRVRPLPGFRTTWVTEITHVDRPSLFVDEQRVGPYKLWHHQHRFREIPGGVEMEDEIHYALPFGWLGRIFHKPIVLSELRKIFAFRQKTLIEMFGDRQNST